MHWTKKKHAVGIFIDLKKAFDTINHSILLKKFKLYGIRGVAGEWLRSYLTGRVQYVKMGLYLSNTLDISCGVPQGSVLGPKLFNVILYIYINDIVLPLQAFNIITFIS